jgi:hypothetical protein
MRRHPFLVFLAIAILGLASVATSEDKPKPLETFTGRVMSVTTGQAGVVEIVVNRWSPPVEKEILENVLAKAGSPAMVDEMERMPQVGYIRTPETMGDALFYGTDTMLPDGTRQVVFATNRPISAMATIGGGAKNNYDLSVIEIRFKKGSDKGEGKIVIGGKAAIDPKTHKLSITNYDNEPPRFSDVKSKKG